MLVVPERVLIRQGEPQYFLSLYVPTLPGRVGTSLKSQ